MAFEVKALLTNETRRRRSEGDATGKSYRVVAFELGNQGHDPGDPTMALTPDPDMTTLPGLVFGPKALSGYAFANDTCPVYEGYLDFGEAVTAFSSLGLLAQIVYSPVPNDPELGTTFLYAVANFALRPKDDLSDLSLVVGVQR